MSLSVHSLTIRPIEPRDSQPLADLILSVLKEFGCVGEGYASADPELQDLYNNYSTYASNTQDRGYWVIVDKETDKVYGGGGFAPLKGLPPEAVTCELQKVYFHPELRGMGFGRKMVEKCMDEASRLGYHTMYLESVGVMSSAVRLYEKIGFQQLSTRLGNTGHSNCLIFMSRPLRQLASVS